MKRTNQKGEGLVQNLLFLLVLAGLGFAAYIYLWPMYFGPQASTASTAATPVPSQGRGPKAGSMAGAAVQGAEAAGEVYGSGN